MCVCACDLTNYLQISTENSRTKTSQDKVGRTSWGNLLYQISIFIIKQCCYVSDVWRKALKRSRETHQNQQTKPRIYDNEMMTDAVLQIMEKDRLVNAWKSQKQNRIPTLNHAKSITRD